MGFLSRFHRSLPSRVRTLSSSIYTERRVDSAPISQTLSIQPHHSCLGTAVSGDVESGSAKNEEMELCSLCSMPKVYKKATEDANRETPTIIRGFISKLTLSAEEGCQTCSLVLDAIVSWSDGQNVDPSFPFVFIFLSKRLKFWFRNEISGSAVLEVLFSSKHSAMGNPTPANNVWGLLDSRLLLGSTSSDSTLQHLAYLMRNCEKNHKTCSRPFVNPLPKRILEIATGIVYLREPQNVSARYACLSHCWGPLGPTIRLTKASFSSLSQGLVVCQLPKTFQDAVVVCQSLKISYLWIDAMCIIQDSPGDWEEAANTMADIYENACITIAAASAADSTRGLFSPDRTARRLSKHPQFHTNPLRRRLPPNYFYQCIYDTHWPLLGRAWVYQERTLSPRVVYFSDDQIYWDCNYEYRPEDDCEAKVWAYDPRTKWWVGTKDPTGGWWETVNEYSGLQLTYEKDRLPAIAAVANRISLLREPGDVYLAGMWKNSITSDLCWYCDSRRGSGPGPRPGRTAPSWSWASTQKSRICSRRWKTCKVQVMSLTYNIVGGTYLGTTKDCKLVLRGYFLPLTEMRGLTHEDISDIHGEGPAASNFMLKPLRLLLQRIGLRTQVEIFYPDFELKTAIPPFECGASLKLLLFVKQPYEIGGLVLRQLSRDSEEYERIGFIQTVINYYDTREMEMDCIWQSVPIEDILIV